METAAKVKRATVEKSRPTMNIVLRQALVISLAKLVLGSGSRVTLCRLLLTLDRVIAITCCCGGCTTPPLEQVMNEPRDLEDLGPPVTYLH